MNTNKRSPLQKAIAIGMLVVICSIAAFASPTLLSTAVLIQNNAQVTAGQLLVTPVACDNVNGNTFNATGREILFLQNTDASPHNITVSPVADPYGGTNTTLTNYSLAANSISMVQMKYLVGWANAGVVTIPACSSNLIKIAVVQFN